MFYCLVLRKNQSSNRIDITKLFFPIPLGTFGCSILINIQISINAAQYKVDNVWVSTLPFTQFIIIECARSCHIHESDKYKEILIGYNEFINIVIQVFRTHVNIKLITQIN